MVLVFVENYKIVDSFVNHWLFRLIFKSTTVLSGKVSVYEGCGHVQYHLHCSQTESQ